MKTPFTYSFHFLSIFLLSFLISSQNIFAQAGALDNSFGEGGIVKQHLFSIENLFNTSVLYQSNGKIIICGFHNYSSEYQFAMFRFTSSGKLDSTFGNNGLVNTKIDTACAYITSVVLQSDDKIVAAGILKDSLVIARFNANGSTDSTFAKKGYLISSASNFQVSNVDLKVAPDGKIVAAVLPNLNGYLVRYLSNGEPDSAFGKNGIVKNAFAISNADYFSISIQSTGKIILATSAVESDIGQISRFNTDGTLDNTFATNGTFSSPFGIDAGGEIPILFNAVVDSADRIIIAAEDPNNFDSIKIMRLQPEGGIDNLFGNKGVKLINFSSPHTITSIGASPKGIIDLTFYNSFQTLQIKSNGKVDSAFGTNGFSGPALSYSAAYSQALQADNKIIIAGSSNNRLAIYRLTSTGALDATFGNNGMDTVGVPDAAIILSQDMLIQPDGKILVSGVFENGYSGAPAFVLRYNSDGMVDSSFGARGAVFFQPETNPEPHIMALQSSGKILVAYLYGYGPDNEINLTRFNSNGSLDSSFGTNGTIQPFFGFEPVVYSMVIQDDGKILLAGKDFLDVDEQQDVSLLMRLDSNGEEDPSFSSNGLVKFNFKKYLKTYNIVSNSIALQPDKKIIISPGISHLFRDYSDKTLALIRYNADGSLDSSFGSNGSVNSTINTDSTVYSSDIALQSDGKIIQVGPASVQPDNNGNNHPYYIFLKRYLVNGATDSSFGNDGITTTELTGIHIAVSNVRLQPDGKILVSAENEVGHYCNIILTRYNQGGITDSTFGINGTIETPINIFYSYEGVPMRLQGNGKILVTTQTSPDLVVVRYLNDIVLGIVNFSTPNNTAIVYPNPIHQAATLKYTLSENEKITIDLFDINGKLVKSFITNEYQTKGNYSEQLNFDASLSAGNYFLAITNGKQQETVKIVKM